MMSSTMDTQYYALITITNWDWIITTLQQEIPKMSYWTLIMSNIVILEINAQLK